MIIEVVLVGSLVSFVLTSLWLRKKNKRLKDLPRPNRVPYDSKNFRR